MFDNVNTVVSSLSVDNVSYIFSCSCLNCRTFTDSIFKFMMISVQFSFCDIVVEPNFPLSVTLNQPEKNKGSELDFLYYIYAQIQ